jgi:hypothetical protein
MVVLGRTVNAFLRNTERDNVIKYNARYFYTEKCENFLQLLADPVPILTFSFLNRSVGTLRYATS